MTLFLLIAATYSFGETEVPKSVHAPVAQEAHLTPAQMVGIGAFWRECLQKEAVGTVRLLGTSKHPNRIPPGCLSARVADGAGAGRVDIDFASNDGTVFSYTPFDDPEIASNGRTHKDALPGDKAWERVLRILKYYDLPTARNEYEIKMEDHCILTAKDDLYGAYWHVMRQLSYQGVPCRGSYILVDVSASTGEVTLVVYSPVIVPRVAHRLFVSREEAVRKAQAWLGSTDRFKSALPKAGGDSLEDICEVIARPHDPGFGFKEKGIVLDSGESFYCWQVPYVFDVQDGTEWARDLWVRVDTGEVIGGY